MALLEALSPGRDRSAADVGKRQQRFERATATGHTLDRQLLGLR